MQRPSQRHALNASDRLPRVAPERLRDGRWQAKWLPLRPGSLLCQVPRCGDGGCKRRPIHLHIGANGNHFQPWNGRQLHVPCATTAYRRGIGVRAEGVLQQLVARGRGAGLASAPLPSRHSSIHHAKSAKLLYQVRCLVCGHTGQAGLLGLSVQLCLRGSGGCGRPR
jgi:hypothetical protein